MRSIAVCCCLAVLAGCAKPEQQAAAKDTTAATMAAGATPAAVNLASLAGKWNFKTRGLNSDSVLVSYEMVTTADQNGWVINFPGRPPVPVRVTATGGDSIVTEAGPYESMLRKGVQVSTNTVMHFQDNKLIGTTVAHYSKGADTVLNLRTEGVRAQ
jgi:hypothetical protein